MKKVLVFYPYFSPAFMAGGPIQSIVSMVAHLHHTYEFYIFCTNKDLDGTILPNIVTDSWVDYQNGAAKVWYASTNKTSFSTIKKAIEFVKPSTIFIIGMFDIKFTIFPLLVHTNAKKIISARGMLLPEALAQKSFKKQCFLAVFKACKWHAANSFHATSVADKDSIKKIMGASANIATANNFPVSARRKPMPEKEVGSLQMCTIALISPMKNILLVLQALALVKTNIHYNIYGPIKELGYWNKCKALIETLPKNITVNYKGVVNPENVAAIVGEHHVYIQPSESENFGHALYQALLIGRPIITSHATPWNNLLENSAGVNVNPSDVNDVANVIEHFAAAPLQAMQQFGLSASKYADSAIDKKEIVAQYIAMFEA